MKQVNCYQVMCGCCLRHADCLFFALGQINLLMEMVDQAMADFETAVKLKPDFSIACVQRTYTDYRHACATEVGLGFRQLFVPWFSRRRICAVSIWDALVVFMTDFGNPLS